MICPNCKTLVADASDFCIFCGKPFTQKGKRTACYSASMPVARRSAAGRAERLLYLFALFTALIVFGAILFSPGDESKTVPAAAARTPVVTTPAEAALSPTPAPTPAATATPVPTPTETAEATGPFSGYSGDYPVVMYLSVGESDDPETQAATDALLNKRFDGAVTLAVDETGRGTVSIDQAFFSREDVPVSAFVNSEGAVSDTTLYGVLNVEDYKLTVVCVCADDSVSGFIWMDNALTHIEFLYFG